MLLPLGVHGNYISLDHRNNIQRVNLDRYGLCQHLDGKNQSIQIFFARKNTLHAFKRTADYSNALTAAKEGVRLKEKLAVNGSPDCLDLLLGNCCYAFSAADNHVHPWSRQHLEPAFVRPAHKHITREQRQRQNLPPVLPPARRLIQRQKNLEAFGFQHLANGLLVLVPGVDSAPGSSLIRPRLHAL